MRPGTGDASAKLQKLTEWTRTHFGVGTIAYQWAAQDNDTTDGLPYIGRLDEHLWVATGSEAGHDQRRRRRPVASGLLDGDRPQWADGWTRVG
jgi:hypothetical protein